MFLECHANVDRNPYQVHITLKYFVENVLLSLDPPSPPNKVSFFKQAKITQSTVWI